MVKRAHTQKYREKMKKERCGKLYSGWGHLFFTSSVGILVIVTCLFQLESVLLIEWTTVPLTFFYANGIEFFAHSGPMHIRFPGLRMIYQRHTLEHHRYFTKDEMLIDGWKDLKFVLFPPILIIFIVGGGAVPLAFILYKFTTLNTACLFVATAIAYFLNYEWFHLAYHLSSNSLIGRVPGFSILRKHHTIHHDVRLMRNFNFNITFPIWDTIMGRVYKEKS